MEVTLTCLRCGHNWKRRAVGKLPAQCPDCHSPRWDKPRKNRRSRPKLYEREEKTAAPQTDVEMEATTAKEDEFIAALLEDEPQPPATAESAPEFHPLNCDCTMCLLSRGILG